VLSTFVYFKRNISNYLDKAFQVMDEGITRKIMLNVLLLAWKMTLRKTKKVNAGSR